MPELNQTKMIEMSMTGQTRLAGHERVSQSYNFFHALTPGAEDYDHFSDSEDEENQYSSRRHLQQQLTNNQEIIINQAHALVSLEKKLARIVAFIIVSIIFTLVTLGCIWASNNEALSNPEVIESTFSPLTNLEPTLKEDGIR